MKKKHILPGFITLSLVLAATLFSCSNLIEELRGRTPAVYQFHETVTELPAGTDGTAGPEWTYVLFGDWPQTIKASDVEVDETQNVTMGANTYYLGSDYNYYAKCTENAYESNYTYSDGTTVAQASANSYKYFKVEPIKWRVLTNDYNGKKLLLAENILTANVKYYDYPDVNRSIGGTTVYPNNYKESRIRAYLNGYSYELKSDSSTSQTTNSEYSGKGFLQSAFTASAQNRIATTNVDNSARSTNTDSNATQWSGGINSHACEDTSDKIFLLSEQEVTKAEYGFADYNVYKGDSNGTTSSTRIRMTTDYAKANYAYQNTTAGYGGWWWLRTPYYALSNSARGVDNTGSANYRAYSVSLANFGVCPALSISF
ncbi:MAG: hypothetical protein J6Y69_05445 [Treponema sp.]|nr:hypothetical protein [Treponema sp.]